MTSIRPDVAMDDRLNIGQAAAVLGLHRSTVYKLIERGEIVACYRSRGHKGRYVTGREILRYYERDLLGEGTDMSNLPLSPPARRAGLRRKAGGFRITGVRQE